MAKRPTLRTVGDDPPGDEEENGQSAKSAGAKAWARAIALNPWTVFIALLAVIALVAGIAVPLLVGKIDAIGTSANQKIGDVRQDIQDVRQDVRDTRQELGQNIRDMRNKVDSVDDKVDAMRNDLSYIKGRLDPKPQEPTVHQLPPD